LASFVTLIDFSTCFIGTKYFIFGLSLIYINTMQ
jgi:hypothetical protein